MKAGEFHGRPLVEQLQGPKNYNLVQMPNRWFGYKDSRGIWWIPRDGCHTDQGTIPLFGQLISGVKDDQCWSFYTHDNGYQFHERDLYDFGEDGLPDLTKKTGVVKVAREEVDYYCLAEGMYTEQLKFKTVNTVQRFLVYRSVLGFQAVVEFFRGGEDTKRNTFPELVKSP